MFDNDRFIPHYDIKFVANHYEYDYEINAETGAVMGFEKEYDNDEKEPVAELSDFISEEMAKQEVLSHAKLSEAEITKFHCELDADDLIAHYEIKFNSMQYEYEYEVNAKTGAILTSDKELDD